MSYLGATPTLPPTERKPFKVVTAAGFLSLLGWSLAVATKAPKEHRNLYALMGFGAGLALSSLKVIE